MIDRVRGQNLFSWEELNFTFHPGVTLVEGFNFDDNTPEGAGKSAIPNIACWTLYGQIPKDAKIDQVIREGEKSGWGEVTLLNGTIIHRSRKPNDLYFQPEGSEPVRGKDARETQQLIEEHLGMGFETFCQAVYFAQNYPNKFITANEVEKGKIISEIQDLGDFTEAKKLSTKKVGELEITLEKIEERINSQLSLKQNFDGQKEEYLRLIESMRKEKATVLSKLQYEIELVEKDLNGTRSELKELSRKDLPSLLNTLEEEINTLEKDKKALQLKLSSSALTIRERQRLEALMEKKDGELSQLKINLEQLEVGTFDETKYKAAKLTLEKDLDEMQTGRSGLLAQVSAYSESISEVVKLQTQIKRKQQTLNVLKNDLSKFENAKEKLCPTCGAVLDKNHSETHKKASQESINVLSEELSDLEVQLKSKESSTDIVELQGNLATIDGAIHGAKDALDSLNKGVLRFERACNSRDHLREKVESLEQEIKKVAEQYETSGEAPDVEGLDSALKSVEKELSDATSKLSSAKSEQLDTQRLEIQAEAKGRELLRLKKAGEVEEQKNTYSVEVLLTKAEVQSSKVEADIERLQNEFAVTQKLLGRMRTLKDAFQEVKAYVFRSVLSELTKKTNKFLIELFEVPVSISFTNEGEDGEVSKILAEVTMDGVPRALGLYSGGQFRRIQLAVDLALSEIIASRSYNPANIRVLDEPFKDLSESSMEKALKLFETLKGSTLLIEHNSMVKAIVNQVFKVELRDKVSREVS